jgi:CubicO group peptidase (beta-lactamase class C family)
MTDTPFADYCQNNIFEPLGMDETSWFLAGVDSNKIATPYTYNDNEYAPSAQICTPFYPGGQLFTSAVQLGPFLMAFIQKDQAAGTKILKRATVDSMTTVQNPLIDQTQGLTWIIEDIYISQVGSRTICGHTGGWDIGINARASFLLGAENIGIIILTNRWNTTGLYQIEAGLFKYGILNSTVGIEDFQSTDLPKKFGLKQNYPNPFNPITKINYELSAGRRTSSGPMTNDVDLSIYNLLGQKVATLVDRKQAAGSYQVQWDASGFASGIYIYRLKVQGQKQNAVFTKKLVLLK